MDTICQNPNSGRRRKRHDRPRFPCPTRPAPLQKIDSILPKWQCAVMTTSTVHVAIFDTLADWEIGYATAHIRRAQWQREPGRYSITTVGPTRAPVTTMSGLRI